MTYDVVICGAGPAGSAVARQLAASGLRVALIGAAARPGWEGLSSRSRELLMEEGVDAQANMIAGPFTRRGVWANGRSVDGVEWLVERAALAHALCVRSREAGADYRTDTVTSTTRVGERWHIALRSGESLLAPLVVDARGRRTRGSRAYNGGPASGAAQIRGPSLLAIGQRYRRRDVGPSGTGIGVTNTGWCWWAERQESLWVQIIGKPRSLHPTAWVAAAATEIPALARVLEYACAEGAAVATSAGAQLGRAALEPSFWLAGDAALALDPLSGQGVYEAVRGARLVATAIQSVAAGGDARVAQRFVDERRAQAWLHGVRVAAGFYRENESCGGFWSDTAAAYEALLPERVASFSNGTQRLAAASPEASSGAARIERRPVLDQGRIVERDVVVTADHPRGVWHVAGVPLAALQEYLDRAEHATADAAAAVLDRSPTAVAWAMNWLRERGPLLPRDRSPVSSGG